MLLPGSEGSLREPNEYCYNIYEDPPQLSYPQGSSGLERDSEQRFLEHPGDVSLVDRRSEFDDVVVPMRQQVTSWTNLIGSVVDRFGNVYQAPNTPSYSSPYWPGGGQPPTAEYNHNLTVIGGELGAYRVPHEQTTYPIPVGTMTSSLSQPYADLASAPFQPIGLDPTPSFAQRSTVEHVAADACVGQDKPGYLGTAPSRPELLQGDVPQENDLVLPDLNSFCETCQKAARKQRKLPRRHFFEVHEKPRHGEPKKGWYMCRCGKNYSRIEYYNRHGPGRCDLRKVGPYYCQCLESSHDPDEHYGHYRGCRRARVPVGRPPAGQV
ncbi:hypothetical protein F5X99DRAFT_381359 [Biscogniauxia marginata]|nr:hypothetical protein F5X99DRAFT_381359 [Biscogniauxia marginata]